MGICGYTDSNTYTHTDSYANTLTYGLTFPYTITDTDSGSSATTRWRIHTAVTFANDDSHADGYTDNCAHSDTRTYSNSHTGAYDNAPSGAIGPGFLGRNR